MKENQDFEHHNQLTLKWLGIDTYKEAVIYMHRECHVCQSEGFEVHARVRVALNGKSILATINYIDNKLLYKCEASLSKYAWKLLGAKQGDVIQLTHPPPLKSLSFVRSKVYGNALIGSQIKKIIEDISEGGFSDIHVATFLAACAGGRLSKSEVVDLTKAMIEVGECLTWPNKMVVDKHCVGGLPGNRTTPIVVAIVTALGLTMPKTSSRAITSPAGTADTMETLAPVDLSLPAMRHVVEQEGGCIVWGGSVALSPADDILIRAQRAMDLDSEGQVVASVLSKKFAAGSSHIAIDIPVGPTAKVRTHERADVLINLFTTVAKALNIHLNIIKTDGSEPIGRGIGPALEANDVLAVLQNDVQAPQDLRKRALTLAGMILEFSSSINKGEGEKIATQALEEGKAWKKFQAICNAQGGLRQPPIAKYTQAILAPQRGQVKNINNRQISRLAKLAGAPYDKAAGVLLHTPLNTTVEKGEPLFTIHTESKGVLNYALSLLEQISDIVKVEASE